MQFQYLIADFILVIHFLIVGYVTAGILLIPIAYKMNWKTFKIKKLRVLHLLLIFFVTFESVFGFTCPLTSIENYLRNALNKHSFISYWLQKIIFWDLPNFYFLILYCACLTLTICWWKFFPPQKDTYKKHLKTKNT